MSFVRVSPVNPKAKTHEVTVRLQRSPSSSGRACLVFGIGRTLVASLGWDRGQTIACLWGLDEDLGSLRLEPSKTGYTLRNPGRKAAGSLALAVYTFHGQPYRIPDAKCPAETAPHELRDGGLVVTLPAGWWGTPESTANYAENYSDPIPAEATSPAASRPSAGSAKYNPKYKSPAVGEAAPGVNETVTPAYVTVAEAVAGQGTSAFPTSNEVEKPEVGEVGIPTTPDLPPPRIEGEGPGHCLVSVPEWMMQALQERGAVDPDGMFISPASNEAAKMDMGASSTESPASLSQNGAPSTAQDALSTGVGPTLANIEGQQPAPVSEPVEAPPAADEPAAEEMPAEALIATVAPFWTLEKHTAGPPSQAAPLGRYWTGQFTKIGLPLTTGDPRQAMTFVDRREASDAREAAIRNDCPEMRQFRAVRPDLPARSAA